MAAGLADAIAVVGLSCRLPGAADPDALWRLLREGRDAITDVPAERWALQGISGEDGVPPGLRRGGFLDQVDRFDARFFGIGPREAAAMDPQQRLALELCWEALEDAGLLPGALAGSATGIFVGAIAGDYAELTSGAVARQTFTGTQRSIIANRVSYTLGLRGPSMTVDTGQSSSLVAVHLACQSLRAGESTVALAGGVQLNLGLDRALALAQLGALSPDGRCFTLDARANGFVRGEGGGVVVLKPLEAALADGDPVYCVIRGSAVNNDGGGDGLTAPEQSAQEDLLHTAYAQAGVAAGDVQYVELHGTGTPLGDRVEAAAVGAVLGGPGRSLAVGSAKTNVGHLEAGAGIVGLLKVALAIEHGELPPSLNFEQPSPDIALDALGLRVPTTAEPWADASHAVAGVSSFGIGGTNCHVVVQAPPARAAAPDAPAPSGALPWVVSGRSRAAVRDSARRLADDAVAALHPGEVAGALAATRTAFGHRAVVVAETADQRLEALRGLADGRPSALVVEGEADPELAADRPVFVFPGQGGQWAGMGAELLERSPAFAAAIADCDAVIAPLAGFAVADVLRDAGGPDGVPSLERIEVVQPVLFAIMVSLARLWQDAGVRPAAVVGHSQGEIAAAHIAGVLSLQDAARIIVVRSQALARIVGAGGMLSVGLSLEAFEQRNRELGDRMTVAAVNAPRSLVVSGDAEAIEQLAQRCETDGVAVRRIQSTVPGHSPPVEAVRDEVLERLATVAPQAATLPVYSTVTAERIDGAAMDAEHWYRNLRQTVRFAPALAQLLQDGARTFIEIGPHPVLTVPVEAIAEEVLGDAGRVAVVATLRRDQGGPQRFATALAELHVRGGAVDWLAVLGGPPARRLRLPTYAFQRERFWLDGTPRAAVAVATAGSEPEPEPDVAPPGDGSFAARVAAAAEAERPAIVLDAVLGEAAAVLGHASAADVDARSTFKELGFDSPAVVELRNRVNALTGLRLSSAALFDVPTPVQLAQRVLADLTGVTGRTGGARSPARAGEPIAIVGMACRYPGDVASPEDLWDLVASGRDAIGAFPADRGWDLQRLIDPDGSGLGTSYVDQGGFLYDAGDFDDEHFGISPREALAMDPQQRLLLECAWEALEDAGLDPSGLRGSATGVFAGVMSQEYGPRLAEPDDRSAGYALTGTGTSVVSGRVSYVLGLEGPAVSVDTACSSSLVALHLACQALRAGECDLALAGGASVMASPGVFVEFSRQRGLSPDGRCRAFGAGADGTGWSEGAGVLVLEPLSVAQARGHRVLAVVRSTATNQDGASNGLTAPSGASQERVILAALAAAGLEPADVDAIEAHGTGTALGDPIEAGALLATYGQDRENGPALLGSLKSNIGHTQAAAGVGGVIKMVQALRHEQLPRTLHADEPSPHVDWDAGAVRLLNDPTPWPAGARVRRAGISSFGMSGTNAHAVIEEAPAAAAPASAPAGARVLPFVVSASTEDGLAAQARRLAEHVAAHPDLEAAAVAGSLALGRAQLGHRAVAVADDLEELADALAAFARGEHVEAIAQGVARRDRRVAFVFPGQGGQWEGMAVALLDASPTFAQHLRACGDALAEFVDWSLEDVLRGAGGRAGVPTLERVDVVQPALWAVMVASARLWETFGVRPSAVVGHSQGEIAAAHIAGALSLRDAARVVAGRSRVLADLLSGRGGMVAVATSAERVAAYLEPHEGRVSVAAVNSPTSVVVSGELDGLHAVIAACEADGVSAKLLPVDYAAHSAQIEAMREPLLADLAAVTPAAGEVPLYSTVTGARLDTATMDAEYWYNNLRQTVRFDEAVRAMVGDGISAAIETGPHPVLSTQVVETVEAAGHDPDTIAVIGSLRRSDGGLERFTRSLADAHVTGIDVDWTPLLGGTARVPLPTYAFQRRRYWLTAGGQARDPSALGQAPAQHPLLDASIALAAGQGTLFTGRLSLERHPWLADHVVLGQVLLPAAAFVDLVLHVGGRSEVPVVDELTLSAPLALVAGQAVALQVAVTDADDDGRRRLTIHSRADGADGWTQHAAATLAPERAGDDAALRHLAGLPWPPAGTALGSDATYEDLADAGYAYGPAFQGLGGAWRSGDRVVAQAALGEGQEQHAAAYGIHPALLDAVLQAAVLAELDAGALAGPIAPFSFSGIRLHAEHATDVRAALVGDGAGTRIAVVDAAGSPVLSIDAFVTRPLDLGAARAASPDALHVVGWEPVTVPAGDPPGVATLADPDDLGALAAQDTVPDIVLAPLPEGDDIHAVTERTLALLQAWLAAEPLAGARLVVLTRGALAVGEREAPDLAQAAAVGLVRSAHSEHPDRFGVLDLDGDDAQAAPALVGAFGDEAVLALRDGALLAPRLLPAATDAGPRVGGAPWRMTLGTPGSLDDLAVADAADAQRPLSAGEVRVAVHAAGLNFKDVVVALGLIESEGTLGLEGSGVVVEVAPDVTDLVPGDRVMGLIAQSFGPLAVVDRQLVVPVPAGWTHVQAASVPVVFLTAYAALAGLAELRAGESVLVHGAAGGVGMAALQIARHLGAEVFATAHPDKWPTLRALGLDDAHIASSRDLAFRDAFLQATGGRGVDVVLDHLAGAKVDASLELLPRGGRFVELGKTDVRDPARVAADHPGVRYQAFSLSTDLAPERVQALLVEVLGLFERGVLHHLPIATSDVRDAAAALQTLRESRHTGKLVLRVPQPLDPDGTVLITGGTGGLGAMLATHLAERHGARHLLLASRSGPRAEGADALVAALAQRGCEATVAACDVTDRAQLETLLAGIPAEHPLTAVAHLAGAFDDGVVAALDAERLERVLTPKVDPALHLDALTREHDLAEFLMYSSVAATFGLPGQGNYAAANAVLDALAQRRRAEGLPGLSLGLGVWQTATALTRRLTDDDGVLTGAAGMIALPDEEGLALVDAARALDRPLVLPVLLDRPKLRAQARAGVLAPVLRRLFAERPRAGAARGGAFAAKLAAAPEAQREAIALELTREHLAAVLGHGSAQQLDEQRTFKELGIDSLSGVELRNRIAKAAGLTLPATLVFDHPTPAAVARLLCERAQDRSADAPDAAPAAPQRVDDDPIAIVGIGCRFPGGVRSAQDLWELVVEGRSAIGEFPTDRGWDLERLFDDDPEGGGPGTSRMRRGGFLYDAGDFDAEHFSISPREALTMDPQQRVLLECAWEALEDAGIDPLSLRGSRTGVFAGVFESGYVSTNDAPELTGFRVLGGVNAAMSGRVSYVLGLEGPAVSIDTACSSSLVSLHLGAQALRTGECDLVLAGGVTVMSNPEIYAEFSLQGALSADGVCRAFGAGADGTGLSEGAGLLVLERLSDAARRGHEVLAVLRGSATNQDGASNGMSAPNGPAQERVIRAALANAGLAPAEVDVVEAHGTGTALGDPLEAHALLATYGQDRRDGPLLLGSLKSNIGHTQAAAGVGGVIKMVMSLRHEQLPRTLHVEDPSPHIEWDAGQVRLLTEPQPWPAGDRPRRAAVSAFGLSGTNAHLVLEEAPAAVTPPTAGEIPSRVLPFVVSASSDEGLAAQVRRLAEHVTAHPELEPAAVARALASSRARLPHRAVAVTGGLGELAEALEGFARGELVESIVHGVARRTRRVAFVFPGQGGQWEGMAVALWDASPVFAQHMRACGDALAEFVDWSLEDVVRGASGAPSLERIEIVQPVLFAIMVSLARLWESFGVQPAAVVGHSQGEIAAAHIAGGLSLQDAARIVAVRSLGLSRIAGVGGMLSVGLSPEQFAQRTARLADRVTIAAVNAPKLLVVSGDPEAIDELAAGCEADGIAVRRILSTVPGHSPAVEAVRDEVLAGLAPVAPTAGSVPLFSTVTGERLDTADMDGAHWYRNLRQTVRFEPAVREVLAGGIDALIEIGPHPVVTTPLTEILDSAGDPEAVAVLSTLRRADGGLERIIRSLAEAHAAGVAVDWSALLGTPGARVPLPTYAFQHRRYWLASRGRAGDPSALGLRSAEHPLLDASIALAGDQGTVLTGRLSLERHPWLADHALFGQALLPGTGFLDLALHAGALTDAPVVQELTLNTPLLLGAGETRAVQLTVAAPDEDGRRAVTIHSRREGETGAGWTLHATATLVAEPDGAAPPDVPPPSHAAVDQDVDAAYERLSRSGYDYGPTFQALRQVAIADGEATAEVALDEKPAGQAGSFRIHPALADAVLQALALAGLDAQAAGRPEVPFSFSGIRLHRAGAAAARAHLRRADGTWRIDVVDDDGAPILTIDAVAIRTIDARSLLTTAQPAHDALFALRWTPRELAPASSGAPVLALLGDDPAFAALDGDTYADLAALEAAVAAGAPVPDRVLVAAAPAEGHLLTGVHDLTERTLHLLQAWLASEALAESRLVVVTRVALAAAPGDVPNLAHATLPGLLRSAHTEHPDRVALIDLDDTDASRAALAGALALDEPEIALRAGTPSVARLARADLAQPAPEPSALRAGGTVLVTGGTSGLGALTARHLAGRHGATRLLLASRRGASAPEADGLRAELAQLGCEVEIVACDVSRRDEVQRLLAAIPADRPLAAVVHAAGTLDDGIVTALDAERLHRVLAPKLDAALHLHELTRDLGPAEFILFSAAAGTLGSPGQANYAAANAFLDALAHARRAEGLPALSLVLGFWERTTELTRHLTTEDGRRVAPLDLLPMSDELGLELIDAARGSGETLLAPIGLDVAALRTRAAAGVLPDVLRDVVPAARARASAQGGSLARTLGAAPEADRDRVATDFVRGHVAAVLGHASPDGIEPDRPFKELGIDSLSAVELRNRLAKTSGLTLPATLVFDHPTPAAVAALLRGMVDGRQKETRARPARRASVDEPIAIVGMACRYPGDVASPDDLWELVAAGRDVIGAFPADRGWDVERLFDPTGERPGTISARHGGFLTGGADFDAAHFGISPREALAMDPQQRLMLECSWEALEDAGLDPLSLRGSSTGVFVGTFDSKYGVGNDVPELQGHRMLGITTSAGAGRVSYTLGLEGPAVSVDTACSSSLVAVHLAGQALRGGECDLALAGGVSVIATPELFVELTRQRGLSPDGRCRAFGAGANGAGFSDGVGVLVLERLSVARERGHRVLALVRATAVNQDGASNGFAAPNGPSQERVIRAALASAGLEPGDVDAVEAHGTGTTLGDPIEAGALLATYGQDREHGPALLGSLKSNIGHTQAAAGVGGVIKMVQALRHEQLPRTLHADEPSPHIDWGAGDVRLLTEPAAWPAGERVRRAGISSFGMSGTNAHLVLEEAPAVEAAVERPEIRSRVLPFVLSASSEAGLAAQADRIGRHVAAHPELDAADVAGALALGRAHLAHRAVAVVGGLDELAESLGGLARGEFVESVVRSDVPRSRRVAFVFPGQGGQWEGMAVALWDASPVFAQHMRACGEALAEFVDWSLEDVVRGASGAPSLERIEIVQPVLFAIMVSLARLWESFGVQPAAVAGHSQGEIVAAHIAGGLSLRDATRIVAARSLALSRIAGGGGMLSVGLSPEELAQRTSGLGDRITIAAINAPRLLVVSGDPEAIEELAAGCEADGIAVRRIASTVAGHSPAVDAVRDEVVAAFAPVVPQAGSVPLFSTVTGERLDTADMDGAHWYRNLRQTVRFEPAVRALVDSGIDALVEIGPHPVLTTPLAEILESTGDPEAVAVISTLRRADGGLERVIRSLAEAHVTGVAVDWGALLGRDGASRVALPTYAFQHRRYWLAPNTAAGDPSAFGQAAAQHPLLDASISLAADQGTVLTGLLSLERHPWLADHVVLGQVRPPAAMFLDLALHAGAQSGAPVVQDFALSAPLVLEDAHALALQVTVSAPDAEGRRRLAIHARPDGREATADWVQHAAATLAPEREAAPRPALPARPAEATAIAFDAFYDRLERAGVECGPAFQAVADAWEHDGEVVAELELPESDTADAAFHVHPALLDAALQPACLLCAERRGDGAVLVATGHDVRIDPTAEPAAAHVRVDAEAGTAQVVLADADGRTVGTLDITLAPAAPAAQPSPATPGVPRDALLRMAWQEVPSPDANGARYMLLSSANGLGLDVETHADLGSVAAAIDPGHHGLSVAFADFRTPAAEATTAEGAHAAVRRALELLQTWLRDERLAHGRLVVLTGGAVAAQPGDTLPDLAAAAVWGLVRSAQSEHPDRFVLADLDGSAASEAALLGAVTSGEPQLALRDGRLLVPRLAPLVAPAAAPDLARAAAGTVLVVGGSTGVGAVLARRLVTEHGVRHLLLTSRRGAGAPGAAELVQELAVLGATAEIAACDIGDRAAVQALLATIPAERPLTGVVHAAVVSDNSLIESMTAEQADRVLAPKVDGALHLHALTADLDLGCFVVCSSMAATFGGPGQGNYAAANAFLDALAEHRRARGLPGTSVQWGLWEDVGQAKTVAGRLEQSLTALSGSAGFRPFPAEVGGRLFDAALAADVAVVVASPYRLDVVRSEVQTATAPRLLSGLVRTRRAGAGRRAATGAGAGAPRQRPVADETRAQIAAALGYEALDSVQMKLSFLELGFDSLVSLELRKRLQAVMGVQLPATVLFDHPTPAALVEHLSGLLGAGEGDGGEAAPASSAGPAANASAAEQPLIEMFRRAHHLGKLRDGMAIAEAAASLRPRFGVSHVYVQAPATIPLAAGDAEPVLFCIPSLVASSGPHEYARFAKAFQGRREVVVVPVPGFAPGELLASRLDALAGTTAAAIVRHAAGRPVAIAGFSTGGLLGHAVAAECVREGVTPAAVVLIDSYTMETAWPIADTVIERMLTGDGEHPAVDEHRLTTMGAYLGQLSRWTPAAPVAPTLLLKATEPVPGLVPNGDWTATWTERHAAIDIPGSHLTVLEDHVATTAQAVEDWLVRRPMPAAAPARNGARRLMRFRTR